MRKEQFYCDLCGRLEVGNEASTSVNRWDLFSMGQSIDICNNCKKFLLSTDCPEHIRNSVFRIFKDKLFKFVRW